MRRALFLMALVVPGHALSYALVIGATHVLSVTAFGIFYSAISITNVLTAPAVVLSLFVSRRLVRIRAADGTAVAVAAFRLMFRRIAARIGVAGIAVMAAMTLFGAVVGVESFGLVLVIAASAAAIYLAETVRAALQGLQRFTALGVAGLSWMAARFVLAMAALVVLGTPWAGMAGVLAAGLIFSAVFHRIVVRRADGAAAPIGAADFERRKIIQLGLGYGLFGAVIYLDVLAGYLLLDREVLGVYAASSVLPKALVLVLMPIGQVMFPVVVGEAGAGRIRARTIAKALGLTLVVGVAGAVAIGSMSGVVCTGPYAIKQCGPDLMAVLLAAAVPLCLLRVLVLVQFARDRDLHPLLLAVPVAAYAAYLAGLDGHDLAGLAQSFAAFAWATLALYGAACLAVERRPAPMTVSPTA